MKKYLLAAALVMVSASAMADRTVSGNSLWGPRGQEGGFESKAQACDAAKDYVERAAIQYREQVEGFSKCDCDEDKKGRWSCTVDGRLEAKH